MHVGWVKKIQRQGVQRRMVNVVQLHTHGVMWSEVQFYLPLPPSLWPLLVSDMKQDHIIHKHSIATGPHRTSINDITMSIIYTNIPHHIHLPRIIYLLAGSL